MKIQRLIMISALACITSVTSADSQWRGANRDGQYTETGLLQQWPEGGPRLLWSTDGMGTGWGSVSAGPTGRFVVGSFNKQDHLISLDEKGTILWKFAYGPNWNKSFPDSRCTPTVVDGWVYVSSGSGQVACLNAETGKCRWSVPALEENKGQPGPWGISESLLLVDDKVIFTPGGDETTVVALNKETGQIVWRSPSLKDKAAYASPILIERGGKRVIVAVTAEYVVGVDSHNGDLLWQYHYFKQVPHPEHKITPYVNCVTPLYYEGRLFVTSGYDHGGVLLDVAPDNSGVQEIWQQAILDNHIGGVVLVDGTLYGSNWKSNNMGYWVAVDWDTGEVQYQEEWQNKGSIIYADHRLYCYEEKKGHVALVKPNPEHFDIVGGFQVTLGEKQHWAHPSIYDKVLYLRHGDVVMAYSLDAGADGK